MNAISNILVCRRFTKYKHPRIHFTTNQLISAIIILAVYGNTIVACNASANIPNDYIDCTTYNTCSQCTGATACEWLFEKQSCIDSDQAFTSTDLTKKSCPKFKVTAENYKSKDVKMTVISEGADNFKTLLDENKIKCQVGEELKHVTVENDNTISCYYSVPDAFLKSCHNFRDDQTNPLFIGYFSIIIDNSVRVKFDEIRDHYLAVYPCSPLKNGTSCSVLSDCTTASWEDGPNQYFCKWCLDNKQCVDTHQEGKCYATDTAKGKPSAVGDVVHVKGDDVRIEDFRPSEGPVTEGTGLTVKIRGHRVLGAVHNSTTVTVAGRECRDPKTLADGETIACTVVANETNRDRGPVVVTYRSAGHPAIELVVPHGDDGPCDREPSVEPGQSFAGIASGGTLVSVRGSFGCARDPRLYVRFNGTRVYGDVCSAADDRTAAELRCRAPPLPGSATAAAYDVGLRWTYRGRAVDADVSDGHYLPRHDPVFTDFRVDGHGHTVTIRGLHVDGAQTDDVTVRLLSAPVDGGDAGDECVVQSIDQTSVVCAVVPSTAGDDGRSAANANALVVRVGRNLNQTLELKRSDAVVLGDRPERPLSGAAVPVGIFSVSVVMLLAVALLVRAAISRARRQRKKWYTQQIRDITAGIDEESL